MRKNGRKPNELRDIKITKDYVSHPEGSVLVEFGNTKVICNATVENNVPRFLKGRNMAGSLQSMECFQDLQMKE